MIVNSLAFLWFFLIVLVIYYICQQKKELQNLFLLISSYWFYSQVDIKMTLLLVILTLFFWLLGKGVAYYLDQEDERKAAIVTNVGVIIGIGALFYFKYLNFFAESVTSFASLFGIHLSWTALNLVVPIGLSFFTFKLMSYVLDIYHGKIMPEKNIINFANFIAFFPTILSGPIDRPKPFLKQVNHVRLFNPDNFLIGFRRVLWGMFLKMCIADRLDIYISAILDNYTHHSAISIIIASLLYPLQMYADFAGYSDMAIGVALILGFKVAENFKRPFFSTNISEYWRRWHMSLTSWLTDYVFLPLNIKFRRYGVKGTIMAIIINMLFVGLWHGANWTFFVFGLYHGLLFIPLLLNGLFYKKNKEKTCYNISSVLKVVKNIACTYFLVTIGQLIFRAPSIPDVCSIFTHLFDSWEGGLFYDMPTMINAFICFTVLLYVDVKEEWFPQKQIYLPTWVERWRWELTASIEIICVLLFGVFDNNQFIYFQF